MEATTFCWLPSSVDERMHTKNVKLEQKQNCVRFVCVCVWCYLDANVTFAADM